MIHKWPKIKIKYRIHEKCISVDINAEQYFDMSPEYFNPDIDLLEVDSVPKYLNELQYIDERDRDLVQELCIDIIDKPQKKRLSFNYVYWNNHRNSLVYRRDYELNKMKYGELIIEALLPEEITNQQRNTYEITRIGINDDTPVKYYHAYITDQDDGSQQELLMK